MAFKEGLEKLTLEIMENTKFDIFAHECDATGTFLGPRTIYYNGPVVRGTDADKKVKFYYCELLAPDESQQRNSQKEKNPFYAGLALAVPDGNGNFLVTYDVKQIGAIRKKWGMTLGFDSFFEAEQVGAYIVSSSPTLGSPRRDPERLTDDAKIKHLIKNALEPVTDLVDTTLPGYGYACPRETKDYVTKTLAPEERLGQFSI
ncbi:MAG: hypothetical protein V1859_01010 [archaeon]